MSEQHLIAGEPNPALYPNLHAILAGCVSGGTAEWTMIRAELRKLCSTLDTPLSAGTSVPMFEDVTTADLHVAGDTLKTMKCHRYAAACYWAARELESHRAGGEMVAVRRADILALQTNDFVRDGEAWNARARLICAAREGHREEP